MLPQFYMPEKYMPGADRRKDWEAGGITTLEESGKIACAQCWIYQTWIALRRAGCLVPLVHSLPDSGIVVTLTGLVDQSYSPPPDVYFAGIVADYRPHPGARLHIVQNSAHARRLYHSAFMPLWPHPNLVPRNPARGGRFENVCFYGDPGNLAPELRDEAWQKRLADTTGVRFTVCRADRWHDYSEADCVVAIRGFGPARYLHKPATKLYNAWLAGVPFIGGTDSAYASDGRAGRDFLQARTPDELIARIRQLKEDQAFREKLVAEGRATGAQFSPGAILERWKRLIQETLPRQAGEWFGLSPVQRRLSTAIQAGSVWIDSKIRR